MRTIMAGWTAAVLAAALMSALAATEPSGANCAALRVVGDPALSGGAAWTYESTDDGERFALSGVLFAPPGTGPFAAVLVSHGKGGTPRGYSARMAREMVRWGLVVIAPTYTHAPDAADRGHAPVGPDGASEANVARARKTRALLRCLPFVDSARVAAHGHSMGAFVTTAWLAADANADDVTAASHTAGGVGEGPNAPRPEVAARLSVPYQLHHGDADRVVSVAQDRALARVLTASGAAHELHVYAGYDHERVAFDALVLSRVRAWYERHGVLSRP